MEFEYLKIFERRWLIVFALLLGTAVSILSLWNISFAINLIIDGLIIASIFASGRTLSLVALEVTVISIVFGRIAIIPIYGRTPDLLYIDVFATLATLIWFGEQVAKGKQVKFDILIPAILYALVSVGTTLVHSTDLLRELALLKTLIMGLVLYMVAYNSVETFEGSRRMFGIFVLLGVMITANMAITFTTANLWRSVISDKTFIRFVYGRHNDVAAFLEIFILLAASQIRKDGSFSRNILFAFSLIIMFVFLILTQSRGAMLSLVLALVVGGGLVLPKKVYFKALGITILIGITVVLLLPKSFLVNLIDKFVNLMDYNNQERLRMWQVAWQGFLEHPIFGFGVGSTGYLIKKNLNINSLTPHNYIVEFLAEVGIVGTMSVLYIFLTILKNAWVISKTSINTEIRSEYAFVFLSVIATLIDGLVEPLHRAPQYVVVFWILAGVIAASRRVMVHGSEHH